MILRKIDISRPGFVPGGDTQAPSSFLQTPFWAAFKAEHGWKPLYFNIENPLSASGADVFLTVLIRRFTRFATIAYVPMGPDIQIEGAEAQGRFLGELAEALAVHLPKNTFCIRFDPPWGNAVANNAASDAAETENPEQKQAEDSFPPVPGKPARAAPAHVQPPDTVILDLTKPLETLLSEMKGKWRYNIKLSEKKGVVIECMEGGKGASKGIDIFYDLYTETARRDGIAIHSKDYYRDLLHRSEAGSTNTAYDRKPSVRVYVAFSESVPLASIITIFSGDEAVYLYGASSNEKRNLMPAYALQWHAITDAKGAGCSRYDFYGIPPTDNPAHPMHGLYRFKTGFGGTIVHRVGSLDIPLRSAVYGLYRFSETLRTLWYKKIVKLLRRETPRKS